MRVLGAVRVSIKELTGNRVRTFFMMLGVLIGIAAVTIIVSIGEGAKAQVAEKIRRLGGFGTVMVVAGGGATRGVGGVDSVPATLTVQDGEAIRVEIPKVRDVALVQVKSNVAIKAGGQSTTTSVWGVTPNYPTTHLSSLYVQSRDERSMALASAQVTSLLREHHRIESGRADDFMVQTQGEILATAQATGQTFGLLLGSVAGISLLVGGIGILALMVISVRERTREIGVRRAVGARRRDILVQFVMEAMTLSLLGGLVGIVTGFAGGVALAYATGWPTAVSPLAIALAFGVSAAIGIFFGAYPARRAARLDPIVALRAE